ncbi:unnamed protein product [Chrysoparadoxa australica]
MAPANGAGDGLLTDMATQDDLAVLEKVQSFVPLCVRQHYNANQLSGPCFHAQHEEAVVLFADISGFSELASKLGKKGLATVVERINNLFVIMVQEIGEYGGDIIKFAGDCLICIWRANLSHACVAATAASCTMRSDLGTLNDDDLGIHCGLAMGHIQLMHVGGHGHSEFLASGPAVLEAGQALDMSSRGEVVVSPALWRAVERHCRGAPVLDGRGFYWIEGIISTTIVREGACSLLAAQQRQAVDHGAAGQCKTMIQCLQAYVPAPALKYIKQGVDLTKDSVAEIRNVTTLFLRLNMMNGTCGDDNEPMGVQQQFLRLQGLVKAWDGMIRQFVVDDKGCVLIICLGVPSFSHENDAERAINLGLQIRQELTDCTTSIGISTGCVFCGIVGNDARHDYAMVGDAINVAARLCCVYDGDFLVDGETYKNTCIWVAYDKLPPMRLKGHQSPCEVYRPKPSWQRLSILETLVGFTPLVSDKTAAQSTAQINICGREKEKKEILSRLCAGEMLLAAGPKGSGKTTLLTFGTQVCTQLQLKPMMLNAIEHHNKRPYGPFRSAVCGSLGLTSGGKETIMLDSTQTAKLRGEMMEILKEVKWSDNTKEFEATGATMDSPKGRKRGRELKPARAFGHWQERTTEHTQPHQQGSGMTSRLAE